MRKNKMVKSEETKKPWNENRFFGVIKKIKKLEYWPLLITLGVLIISYLAYFAFAYWQEIPNVNLFDQSETDTQVLSANYSIAKSVVAMWNMLPLQIVSSVLLCILAIVAAILTYLKKMTWKRATILLLFAGAILRITYGLYTDNITTRQHDVWRGDGYFMAHSDITMYIYNYFKSPEPIFNVDGSVDFTASYQWYHPQLSHWIFALFMRFNSLFMDNNPWVLYQSIRILTISISVVGMFVAYKLTDELKLSERGKFLMNAIIIFCPMFYRLAGMSNNDPLTIFFMILALYFAIRWYKKQTFFNIIIIAISIGLSMASKLSGALIAIPVALIFLVVLIKNIKEKNGAKDVSLSRLILQFSVFALVVAPLGLYWPIMSYIKYDQPLVAVWIPNWSNIVIAENATFFSKYLMFDFEQFFQYPFIHLQTITSNEGLIQDNNMYDMMLKSPLFGEFSYSKSFLFLAYIMQYSVFLLAIAFVALSVFDVIIGIIKNIKECKKVSVTKIGSFDFWIMALLFFLFLINMIFFTSKYQYACSYDFRYIVPIIIPFGYFIAKGTDKLSTSTNRMTSAICNGFVMLFVAVFIMSSSAFYILIG